VKGVRKLSRAERRARVVLFNAPQSDGRAGGGRAALTCFKRAGGEQAGAAEGQREEQQRAKTATKPEPAVPALAT